jgi:enoyl-CoA hydratase
VALLELTEHGGTTVVRMNRPPANALDPSFIDAHLETIAALRASAPASVVLTGTDAFFSGGADLKAVPALEPAEQARMARVSNELFAAWYGVPFPLVAAVNGHAVAGGLVIALAGDHRVCGTMGRFGLTEVKVGIPYPPSAMAVVQAELTPSIARRLVLRGELFDARAMLDLGVFDEIVADDRVFERALDVAAELATLPSRTYGIIKRSLRREALKRAEDTRPEASVSGWLSDETAAASAAVLKGDRA